jgi:ankyrin repeat protein
MLNQNFNGWPTKTNVPEPNEEAIKYGVTKLHLSAALASRRDARKCLINENMDTDIRDAGGNTPLHYAARYNHAGMVNWLVKHGANVHIQNNQGQNPLCYAYQANAHRAVRALRKHGASTKVKDNSGVLPAATRRIPTKKNAQVPLFAGLEELTCS